MTGVRAYLGMGSNLGERLANLQRAADLLAGRDGISLLRSSRLYETAPVGPPQPDYLNAVIEVEVSLTPDELLQSCLDVEAQMGRVRAERWGPRIVDIDLLTFGREVIDRPGLKVPHPLMHERLFVLAPLLEMDTDPILPGGRRITSLRTGGFNPADVRVAAPALNVF